MEHEPCHGKTETRAGTTKPSLPPAEDATPASKVLGNDDLLSEILRRVDSPTTLVRAALASKRWLRHAADPAFLRLFRERHPPRLIGFYVTGDCVDRPEFVPMPPGTELGAALRRAASMFDAFPPVSSRVWHTRNSRVLFDFSRVLFDPRSYAVRDPLRHPRGAVTELPPPPAACVHAMLLPDDEDGDDATCYCVEVNHDGCIVSAEVSVLRSGAWTVLCSARAELARAPERIPMITLLAGGKVYMVAVAGYLVAVDLAAGSLSAVELPEGVTYEYYGNLVPSRGDDSVLYLFHVTGDRLRVWRRRMDDGDGAGGEWTLRDTVSVKDTCGHLVEKGSDPADGDPLLPVDVVGVGDNAEFAFLELGYNIVVYLNLGSRKAERVYGRDPENDEIIEVHPLFTVWPPVFPALGADEDEELHLGNTN